MATDHEATFASYRPRWWWFRYGFSLRVGRLLVSLGVYPAQKYPSDWRPVVIEWSKHDV